jgi:hypothetical protein
MTAIARRACVLITLLTIFGLSGNLQAQTNPIYFPFVTNNTQTSTEIILTNATGRDANVSLVAYGEAGDIVHEVALAISARTQVIVGPGTFTGLQGWVLASSDVPGVVGNVRVSSASGSGAETAESAQPDTAVVLPFTTQSADTSTEIAVANPNVVNTRVILTVYDANGRVIASDDSVLAPFAMRRGSLSAIFGTDKDYSTASHVIAQYEKQNILSQSTSVVGFEVVRGFAKIQDDPSLQKIFGRNDWAAFAAIPVSSSTNSMTFSQSLRGTDWFSLIGVVNLTGTSQSATVTYATESNRAGTSGSISIPANGSVRISLVDLFGAGQDSGIVRITSTGTIAAFQGLGTLTGSAIATTPGQPTGLTEFLFPLVDETVSRVHARLVRDEAGVLWLEDAGSRNGIVVGHERVQRVKVPSPGALRCHLGAMEIEVALASPDATLEWHLEKTPSREASLLWTFAYWAAGVAAIVGSSVLPPAFWSPWQKERLTGAVQVATAAAVLLPVVAFILVGLLRIARRRARLSDTLRALAVVLGVGLLVGALSLAVPYLARPDAQAVLLLALQVPAGIFGLAYLASVARPGARRRFFFGWAGAAALASLAFFTVGQMASRQAGVPAVHYDVRTCANQRSRPARVVGPVCPF